MWFETELGILAYWAGEWDAADAAFGHLDAWIASVGPHYMEAAAHSCRAKLRVGARRCGERHARHRGRARVRAPLARAPVAAPDARRRRRHRGHRRAARCPGARRGAVRRGGRRLSTTDVSGASSWLAEFALALALTGQAGPVLSHGADRGPVELALDGEAGRRRPLCRGRGRLRRDRCAPRGGSRHGSWPHARGSAGATGRAARPSFAAAVDFWESVGCGRLHRSSAEALMAKSA